jgi:hypothetical protein
MVRKWSYIINKQANILKTQQKLTQRFKFKIFRKNTRFKNFNINFSVFTRKKAIIYKRRTSWKNYLVIASQWTKSTINSKQIINYSQNKNKYGLQTASIQNISLSNTYVNFKVIPISPSQEPFVVNLLKVTSKLSNQFFLNKIIYLNSNQYKLKLHKSQKLYSLLQLKSHANLTKLSNISNVKLMLFYNNFFFLPKNTTNNYVNTYMNKVSSITLQTNLLYSITYIVISLKLNLIYTTLLNIKNR